MRFIILYEGEVTDECDTLAEAKELVVDHIHGCYSLGDSYDIYEHVSAGSSTVKVNFKKGVDDDGIL